MDPSPGSTGREPDDLRLPRPARRFWDRPGLTPRAEQRAEIGAAVLLFILSVGWVWSIVGAREASAEGVPFAPISARLTTSLTNPRAPTAAYLTDAAMMALAERALERQRGRSGALRAHILSEPGLIDLDTIPPGVDVGYVTDGDPAIIERPTRPGIWRFAVRLASAVRSVDDFSFIALRPYSDLQRGRIGPYFLGNWPAAGGPPQAPPDRYARPRGFIEVTLENRDTPVSEHFRLRDFLTKDQANVWPKYLVLEMRLIDKLELIMAELRAQGIDTRGVRVMSGFRTPQYNVGGGRTAGRAGLSRHMYGDAADIYIDNTGSGQMDDLNGDGRVTIEDARVMLRAAERVEARYPELIGGLGLYGRGPGHGPFIHVDTRGYRARW